MTADAGFPAPALRHALRFSRFSPSRCLTALTLGTWLVVAGAEWGPGSHAVAAAVGSGFFISGDGYIVTNNHVVANGKSFEVTTDDGRTYQAKVIGSDPQTDVALIKISVAADFPYVTSFVAIPNG